MTDASAVEVVNLVKVYSGRCVVDQLTFSVQANHHALPGRAVIAQIDSVVVDMGRDVDRAIELRTQLEQDPRFSGVPIVVDLDLG